MNTLVSKQMYFWELLCCNSFTAVFGYLSVYFLIKYRLGTVNSKCKQSEFCSNKLCYWLRLFKRFFPNVDLQCYTNKNSIKLSVWINAWNFFELCVNNFKLQLNANALTLALYNWIMATCFCPMQSIDVSFQSSSD